MTGTASEDLGAREKSLSKTLLFQALEPAARRDLSTYAFTRTHGAGDPIFAAGDEGRAMMAIVTGQVRISLVTPNAREVVLADLHTDEVFGEIALLDGGERSADARALTNVTLLVLERRDVMKVLKAYPESALKLLELLCARIRRSDERMAELAFLDISTRLARALLRILDGPNRTGRKGIQRLSLSQTEMAQMIGSGREPVNRCLKGWERRGVVELKDGWLVVSDRGALELLAAQE
ncbi:Crp/Fnr family transcriptional regulator [Fulvimarina pelagi]|nr:Crp/Fnr family transcriptional regulator [Fulvimarina pelagi]